LGKPLKISINFLGSIPILGLITLVELDATLWPSNSTYLTSAVALVGQIVNMSENKVCHVQMPQLQSSTSSDTVLKHRRSLEDLLRAQKMDVSAMMLLRFDKPDSNRNDNRKPAQPCLAALSTNYKSHSFAECEALTSCTIGPVPLIKTSQMLGYDAETGSMSAGLRTEQILVVVYGFYFYFLHLFTL